MQHPQRVARDELQFTGQHAFGRLGHLDRLAADRNRVVPKPFELDIGSDQRFDQAQGAGAGQVQGNEPVTLLVELAMSTIDAGVSQDGGVGKSLIACLHRLQGIGDCLFSVTGQCSRLRLDVVEVLL